MGKIESQLGSRMFNSDGSQRRFSVEDASGDDQFEIPGERQSQPQRTTVDEALALREQSMRQVGGGNYASRDVKRRIEMLADIGKQTRDVVIKASDDESVTFKLRTLKSKEMSNVMQLAGALSQAGGVDTLYKLRTHTLALSLVSIDGVDVDMLLDMNDAPLSERLAARREMLDEMNEYTLNYLYRMHEELMADNAKLFGIKDENDAKEVAEQIKKSGEGA